MSVMRTSETTISEDNYLSTLAQPLYWSGHVHDNEVVTAIKLGELKDGQRTIEFTCKKEVKVQLKNV